MHERELELAALSWFQEAGYALAQRTRDSRKNRSQERAGAQSAGGSSAKVRHCGRPECGTADAGAPRDELTFLQLRCSGVATARMRGTPQAMSSPACRCDQPDAFFKYRAKAIPRSHFWPISAAFSTSASTVPMAR